MHKTITHKRLERLYERALGECYNPGVCLHCGKTATQVEPDARQYTCRFCKRPEVYGIEEVLLMVAF